MRPEIPPPTMTTLWRDDGAGMPPSSPIADSFLHKIECAREGLSPENSPEAAPSAISRLMGDILRSSPVRGDLKDDLAAESCWGKPARVEFSGDGSRPHPEPSNPPPSNPIRESGAR